MATRTQRICGLYDEAVVLSFDYDDVTGNVLSIRGVNGTAITVTATLAGTGTGAAGRSRTGVFNPGTTTIAILSAQQPRFPVVISPDSGIPEVGNYTIVVSA